MGDVTGEKNQEVLEKKGTGRIYSLSCLGTYSEAMEIKTV